MLIEYTLADGQKISYDTGGSILDLSMINDIAFMYAKAKPKDLPTHVFLHVSIYTDFAKMLLRGGSLSQNEGKPCLIVFTGCGPLIVKPMPYAMDKFKVLVGKQEDCDRYYLDEVFEETVLKDCEKE